MASRDVTSGFQVIDDLSGELQDIATTSSAVDDFEDASDRTQQRNMTTRSLQKADTEEDSGVVANCEQLEQNLKGLDVSLKRLDLGIGLQRQQQQQQVSSSQAERYLAIHKRALRGIPGYADMILEQNFDQSLGIAQKKLHGHVDTLSQ